MPFLAHEMEYDADWKDTGPLVLGKKSQRIRKHEQPYEVVPNMRPVVFVGPSLKGYDITGGVQRTLVKGIMQILAEIFFKNNFSPGLCGHAGGLGLAVEPEKWKKIEFENERGYRNRI